MNQNEHSNAPSEILFFHKQLKQCFLCKTHSGESQEFQKAIRYYQDRGVPTVPVLVPEGLTIVIDSLIDGAGFMPSSKVDQGDHNEIILQPIWHKDKQLNVLDF